MSARQIVETVLPGGQKGDVVLGTVLPDLTVRAVTVPITLSQSAHHRRFPKLREGRNWRYDPESREMLVWDQEHFPLHHDERSAVLQFLEQHGYPAPLHIWDWVYRAQDDEWRRTDWYRRMHGIDATDAKFTGTKRVIGPYGSPRHYNGGGYWRNYPRASKDQMSAARSTFVQHQRASTSESHQ